MITINAGKLTAQILKQLEAFKRDMPAGVIPDVECVGVIEDGDERIQIHTVITVDECEIIDTPDPSLICIEESNHG